MLYKGYTQFRHQVYTYIYSWLIKPCLSLCCLFLCPSVYLAFLCLCEHVYLGCYKSYRHQIWNIVCCYLCVSKLYLKLLMPRPSPLQINNAIFKVSLSTTKESYDFVFYCVNNWQQYISYLQIAVWSGKKHRSYASKRCYPATLHCPLGYALIFFTRLNVYWRGRRLPFC